MLSVIKLRTVQLEKTTVVDLLLKLKSTSTTLSVVLVSELVRLHDRCPHQHPKSLQTLQRTTRDYDRKPIAPTEAKISGSQPKYTITAEVVQIIEKNDGEVIAKQSE